MQFLVTLVTLVKPQSKTVPSKGLRIVNLLATCVHKNINTILSVSFSQCPALIYFTIASDCFNPRLIFIFCHFSPVFFHLFFCFFTALAFFISSHVHSSLRSPQCSNDRLGDLRVAQTLLQQHSAVLVKVLHYWTVFRTHCTATGKYREATDSAQA